MYCTAPLSPRKGRLRSFCDDDDDDYSFDLQFNDVDVAFVLRSFCLGLGLGLEG